MLMCQYSFIFFLLMHLNTLKIRFKVLTFPFSWLRPFSEMWITYSRVGN